MKPLLPVSAMALLLAISLSAPQPTEAEPMQLALQGRLTSAGGGPVADGNYALGIGLYPQAVGGASVFDESFLAVAVSGGGFSEQLGAGKEVLDTAVFAGGQPLWVGITVGKDELPRVPLSRVAYAAQASLAAAAKMAQDVQCSGCVGADDLAKGAVTSDKIAVQAVQAVHLGVAWAQADGPGGAALFALAANTAKQADSAAFADEAAKANSATTATNATNAVNATNAATAAQATMAKGLQCTGCVALGALGADAMAAFVASQDGSATGKLSLDGELALGGSVISGGRFAIVDTAKTACDAKGLGRIVVASSNEKLYYCDGKMWLRFATCGGQCPDAGLVACGAPIVDNCGDVCVGSGTFCSAGQTCTGGKCIGALGSKDNPATSCLALKNALPASASGLYWLDPDGGAVTNAFQTWCEMKLGGGGWTLVAIVGQDGRPTQFTGGTYPRAGATFYGTASEAVGDILNPAKNDSGVKQFSVQGKAIFAASATREVMAWVGGSTDDYLTLTLPATCNPFDPAANCGENGVTGLKLTESSGKVITNNGQMCSTISDNCGYNEVGLHLLDGGENSNCVCHNGSAGSGTQGIGRMWTIFHRSDGGHWPQGVHSAWKGAYDQPGALLVR